MGLSDAASRTIPGRYRFLVIAAFVALFVFTVVVVAQFRADIRMQLLALIVIASLIVVPAIGVAASTCRRLDLPTPLVFPMSWLVLGAAAEFTFFATMVSRHAAAALAIVGAAAGTWLTARALRDAPSRRELATYDACGPFALSAFVSISYVALLSLGISGIGPISAEMETWLRLPPDNVLPHVLALHIAAHSPPKPFFGDWLSSDRPPLQAGFDLMLAALIPFPEIADTRYEAIAIILQSTIFGALFSLCRVVGLSKLRSVGVLLLCWISGFFFLNSVFVWPKLLAAAYGAYAIALVFVGGVRRPLRAICIGANTGLALLSHGGVVFTLPVLVVAWLLRDGKAAVRPLLFALFALVVITAPWTWYQKVYDPPGDRLLKWHIAGHIGISSETFPSLLIHAYTLPDPLKIAANKVANLRTIMPMNVSAPLQQREFFYVRYGLTALWIPFLAALVFVRARRPKLRWAGIFAWIAVGSNLFWCLAMYGPGTTVIHQGSYLTMALMFLAGGIVATEWVAVYAVVFIAQAALFVAAWLPKYDVGAAATTGRICDIAVLIGLAIVALGLLWRPVLARLHRVRLPALSDGKRRVLISKDRDLVSLGIVALVLFVLTCLTHSSLALLLSR